MTNNKPPLPKRKNTRWDKQDYSHPGEYMITICVRDMKQILSKITAGNPQTVGTGVPDRPLPVNPQTVGDDVLVVPHPTKPAVLQKPPTVPHIELTYYGKIADKYINQLNDFYDNIIVLKYVIMPNHIHLLLQIPDGTTRTSSPTGSQTDVRPVEHSVISNFVSTFKRFCHREIGEKIFQRSFHDHVIRDENDMIGAINYIENNPYRWIDKS